jgi:hypothetical protein
MVVEEKLTLEEAQVAYEERLSQIRRTNIGIAEGLHALALTMLISNVTCVDPHQARKRYSDTLHCLYAAVCLVESRSRVTRTFPRRGVEGDRISHRRWHLNLRISLQ